MIGPLIAEGRTAQVFAWGQDAVVKLYRAAFPAEDAQKEARIAQAVVAAGAPAPALRETITHDGRAGLVFDHVSGPTMATDLFSDPTKAARIAAEMADLQLAVHQAAVAELPALKPALREAIAASVLTPPEQAHLLADMDALPDADVLCHFDLHPYNVLRGENGPVLVDWINAHSGPPAADVARSVVLIRMFTVYTDSESLKTMTDPFLEAYLAHYLGRSGIARAVVDRWVPIIAAARLSEGVTEENEALLRLIRGALA